MTTATERPGIGGDVFTGYRQGRCPGCRRVNVTTDASPWYFPTNHRCECGRVHKLKAIVGRHSDKRECGPRCTGATGADCECPCVGRNHGADHRS